MYHRVIILLERACLHNRIGRNWCKFSLPKCATSHRDVIQDCALIGYWQTVEGEFPGNCSGSHLSFVYGSTRGVCGRSLTAGNILFTGRPKCSLYIVLGLCDMYWLLGFKAILFERRFREYRQISGGRFLNSEKDIVISEKMLKVKNFCKGGITTWRRDIVDQEWSRWFGETDGRSRSVDWPIRESNTTLRVTTGVR